MDAGGKNRAPHIDGGKNNNRVQTSKLSGDLITLQPRRYLLDRRRLYRQIPSLSRRSVRKSEGRNVGKSGSRLMRKDSGALAAAVKKGYFKGCEMGSKATRSSI